MTKSSLLINGLALSVYLGWPDKERLHKQRVLLDVDICFPKPPEACTTDKLNDTFCYANLIHTIRDQIKNRKFHLIEYLCCEIYKIVKPLSPKQSKVMVCITKYPKISGLTGCVRFTYWDPV